MFAGILLNYLSIVSLLNNKTCETNWFAITISIFFYASYAVLFANFFYWAYIHKKPRNKENEKLITDGVTFVQPTANGVVNGVAPTTITNGTTQHSVRYR